MKQFLVVIFAFLVAKINAQQVVFKGKITHGGESLQNVSVVLQSKKMKKGVSSQKNGMYELQIPLGSYKLTISAVGLQTITEDVYFSQSGEVIKNFEMKEDLLGIEEVTVTGTHSAFPLFVTPVVVSKISSKVFETTQSLSLSEGLNFTPGLRTETNCQNCGFNQLRINGLDGAYSQILINGRPVFSALTGVYGLEMFPANMIDKIEVVRGSGSAVYGGSAIAGTVNVLTKDPLENSFSLGNNLSLLNGKTPDNTLYANASVVSDKLDKGLTIFAYQRNRKPYDADGDSFSEITKLKNTTFGVDMFWNTSDRNKIKLNLNTINEFRRGGNKFDLLPHESEITEQLKHKIYGGNLSFEHFSKDFMHKISFYTSGQYTDRNSYYGGGLGKVINNESVFNELNDDEKQTYFSALNSYGNSKGFVGVGGVQYNYTINDVWNVSLGSEYKYDQVEDQASGRDIYQKVKTIGNYFQLEWKPITPLTFLLGSRYDNINVKGDYTFRKELQQSSRNFSVFVPRFTAMYNFDNAWKARFSFAQGYRAPQAFDETLHTDVIGGDVVFIEFDSNLKAERSNSFSASVNYTKKTGDIQTNFILEGFVTKIKDAFRNAEIRTDENTGIQYKKMENTQGILGVVGLNAEANVAFGNKVIWQTGLTFQKAEFSEEQTLFENGLSSKKVMRTPNFYGFTTLTYEPFSALKLSYSGVFTGKMEVPHETVQQIKTSPVFFEQNIRGAYTFKFDAKTNIEVSAGIQNIFNHYQKDFDQGAERDPNYIYGPQRPRTFFVGLLYKL